MQEQITKEFVDILNIFSQASHGINYASGECRKKKNECQ